jgi:purine-binding chemotaxis protein CheW
MERAMDKDLHAESVIEKQAVVTKIGNEFYVIDIMKIKEIIKTIKLTPIPKAPDFIEGVINLRGIVIPIVDMRKRFELPISEEKNPRSRIVIVSIEKKIVGLIVDEVKEVIKINVKEIKPPPRMLEGVNTEFIFGVYKYNEELLMILKLDSLLTDEEKEQFRKH